VSLTGALTIKQNARGEQRQQKTPASYSNFSGIPLPQHAAPRKSYDIYYRLEDYPYTGQQQDCAAASCDIVDGSALFDFDDVRPMSTASLMEALTKQPVSVAIFAASLTFQLYQSGIYDWCPDAFSENLDHGVLAVGYGTEEPIPWDPVAYTDGFFLIKNSWGETWGDHGYIKLARDNNDDREGETNGMCGVLLQPSYPVLAKKEVVADKDSVLMISSTITQQTILSKETGLVTSEMKFSQTVIETTDEVIMSESGTSVIWNNGEIAEQEQGKQQREEKPQQEEGEGSIVTLEVTVEDELAGGKLLESILEDMMFEVI